MLKIEYRSKIVTTYESIVKGYASSSVICCPTLMEARTYIANKIKTCETGRKNAVKFENLYSVKLEDNRLHVIYNGTNPRIAVTIISIRAKK